MDKQQYKQEVTQELKDILSWWTTHAVDMVHGGFYGKIDNNNNADEQAPKGAVLNARMLWTFAAAYNLTRTAQYLQMAERAYKYISNYFTDNKYGGIYWTVNYKGEPLDTKKQVYAIAFAIYGLSEYFRASEDIGAKQLAIKLYSDIVKHSYDDKQGGFIEAFTREWEEIAHLRLSDKDANERKTMNTHLHVLEGFANLYRVWPDAALRQRIHQLIRIFLDRIIDRQTHHLRLFFTDDWTSTHNIISYGHDIEAAWLVLEAAEIIQDHALVEEVKHQSVLIAEAASKGLDEDGGMWHEKDITSNHLVKEKHWWPQSEAMVGFYNAYQLTGDEKYLQHSISSWQFIKQYLKDKKQGEWYWGVKEDHSLMQGEDKAGLWKCPYHNSRACIEIINRIP